MLTIFSILALAIFIVSCLLESLIYTTNDGWRHKRLIVKFSFIASVTSILMLLYTALSPAVVLMALLMVYRGVNQMRLVQARMHEQYLKRATAISFYWLCLFQLLMIALYVLFIFLPSILTGQSALVAIAVSLAISGIYVLVYTIRSIFTTRPVEGKAMSDIELPTLTVAIAARNEDSILQQCLESILESDYPKLEVIVLDDCSQDRTAETVKAFAHDGVRFIQGEEPSKTWLAKNAAYQKLLDESTGELILYVGVDVHVHPSSLRAIVESFVASHIEMMGVIPKRTKNGILAAFIQPMRYWWELALPKWIIKHEPVLSTCWIVRREALESLGGFKSVMRAITPEEHLSTSFAKIGAYAFVRSNDVIHITTHKHFRSQWLTAIRTRYPQMHRRPELTAFRVVIMLYFLVSPFVLLPLLLLSYGPNLNLPILFVAISVFCMMASHTIVAIMTNPAAMWLSPLNFPVVVIIDFIALHISMYRYEFGEVIWKGRNVTTPAMHVIPHLPEIDDK